MDDDGRVLMPREVATPAPNFNLEEYERRKRQRIGWLRQHGYPTEDWAWILRRSQRTHGIDAPVDAGLFRNTAREERSAWNH